DRRQLPTVPPNVPDADAYDPRRRRRLPWRGKHVVIHFVRQRQFSTRKGRSDNARNAALLEPWCRTRGTDIYSRFTSSTQVTNSSPASRSGVKGLTLSPGSG